MEDILKQIYQDSNFPGFERFYKFVKAQHPDYKKVDVKKFYDSRISVQLLKKKDKIIQKPGSITSSYENELFQMDITDMTAKFSSFNSNYRYILTCIDVFSRKAYGQPMKNKKIPDCLDAFKKIIAGKNKPVCLFSDNDATFLSHEFTSMLKDNNIIYNVNTKNDHKSLSVIDVFTKKMKLSLTNHMLEENNNNWINHLPVFFEEL